MVYWIVNCLVTKRGYLLGQRISRFKQVDRSTIFLNKISAASPAVQPCLLCLLWEREFEWCFREDLLDRLKVVYITVPILRERAPYITHFIKPFIQVSNRRNGPNVLDVRDERMRLLSEYSWPGNVRQLANIAE